MQTCSVNDKDMRKISHTLEYSAVYFLFQEYKSAISNSARAFLNFSFVFAQFLSLLYFFMTSSSFVWSHIYFLISPSNSTLWRIEISIVLVLLKHYRQPHTEPA